MAKINSKGIHNLRSPFLLLFYVNVILLAKYFPCRVEGCDYIDFVFIDKIVTHMSYMIETPLQ